MKLFLAIIISILFTSLPVVAQIESMQLRGKGTVNYLGFIKVYDAYLYTNEAVDQIDVLSPDVSKCLKLEYDVSLTQENFIEGANTVLVRQHPATQIALVQKEITKLHKAYKPVDEGDTYLLCYDANSSTTTLLLNNSPITAITSQEFSSLYLGIWLGEKEPIDEDLRDALVNIK